MSPTTRRPIALTLVLAAYGIAILCGPAMHRHAPSASRARGPEVAVGVPASHAASWHVDCPVCQFLAQGQIAGERAAADRPEGVTVADRRPESRNVPSSPARTSRPRAPPQV